MSEFNKFCNECNKITMFRYLDCDECKELERECIHICCECGADE